MTDEPSKISSLVIMVDHEPLALCANRTFPLLLVNKSMVFFFRRTPLPESEIQPYLRYLFWVAVCPRFAGFSVFVGMVPVILAA
jgi:hypothetical protein